MPKKAIEEGDTLTIKVVVTRVSEDGSRVTFRVDGQLVTVNPEFFAIEKVEKV